MATRNTASPGGTIIMVIVVISATVISEAYTSGNDNLYWSLLLFLPVIFFALRRPRKEKRKSGKKFSFTRKAT